MVKFLSKIIRSIIVIILATFFTTLIIKASDELIPFLTATLNQNFSQNTPCPEDMVFVPKEGGGFCIDKYENSPAPTCPFSNPQNQKETRENLNNPNCKPLSVMGAIPWRFISQDQAQIACAKAGKRLPTNEEWYLASLGTPDPSSGWTSDDCQVANNWSSQPGLTGSGKNCRSAVGAYDMIGNVWEWVKGTSLDGEYEGRKLPSGGFVASTDGHGIPAITNSEKPDPNYNEDYFWIYQSGIRSFARGGYWNNQSRSGIYSVYLVYQPSEAGPGIGFRCAK